jgi:hypothetical protein
VGSLYAVVVTRGFYKFLVYAVVLENHTALEDVLECHKHVGNDHRERVCVGWKASADLEMYMHHFCFCRVEGLVSALLVPLCQSERTEEGGLADVIRADRPMPRSLLPAAPCVIAEYQGGSMAKIKE